MNDRHRPPPPVPRTTIDLPLAVGARLGPFEIQRLLAKGTTSYVYLASDRALALPVALQEYLPDRLVQRDPWLHLHPSAPWNEDVLTRGMQVFIEESRLLARCEHPALVRVNHLFEANGTAYRVMPFHAGERLTALRATLTAPPAEGPLRELLDPLLGALDTIHRLDLSHGGVTPGNILLIDGDFPLLLGPGAAEAEIRSDLVETLMATVESQPGALQPDPAPTGATADLCALAEVVRYCITGEPAAQPPNARSREPLAVRVARQEGETAWPRYSVEFLSTIDAATSPYAEDWPTSVAQFRLWLLHGAPRARALAARGTAVAVRAGEPAPAGPGSAAHPDRIALDAEPDDHVGPASEPFFLPMGPLATADGPGPHDILHGPALGDDDTDPLLAPEGAMPRPATPRERRRALPAKLAFGGVLAGLAVVIIAWASGAWNVTPSIPLAPDAAQQLARIRPTPPTPATPGPTTPSPVQPDTPPQPGAAAPGSTSHDALPAPPVTAPASAKPPVAPVAQQPDDDIDRTLAANPPGAGPAQVPTPATALAAEPTRAAASHKPGTRVAAARGPADPRAVCSTRTEFALYRCMRLQCQTARWSGHPQCVRLRLDDRVE